MNEYKRIVCFKDTHVIFELMDGTFACVSTTERSHRITRVHDIGSLFSSRVNGDEIGDKQKKIAIERLAEWDDVWDDIEIGIKKGYYNADEYIRVKKEA